MKLIYFVAMFLVSVQGISQGPILEDVAPASGLKFTHFNGMTGEFLLPEIMGAGCALLDYDGDGDLDVYMVQGAVYPDWQTKPMHPLPTPLGDRLFRNNLESGKLGFTDVTQDSGIVANGFGMGVATGDINNDGFVDIYVANLGSNQLWLNQGNGHFKDITASAGVDDTNLSTSAAFADYDGDGLLDLYVCNYMVFSAKTSPKCYANNSALDYCGPDAYTARADRLFRNKGNGVFEDRSQLLSEAAAGAGLGVVTGDYDDDGMIDFYVANDGDPNHLWRNKGDGSFEETALFSGVALNGEGSPEAGMGVCAGDFDGDGDEDIFLTHLDGETNTLYVNQGGGFFDDHSNAVGLGLPSLPLTGFGTNWFDLNNDGWLDLLVLNGAVRTQFEQKDAYPLKQVNQLYLNKGGTRFEEISKQASSVFSKKEVSRGAAFGDVDNDGDTDVLVSNNLGPARLLLNTMADGKNWLGVNLKEGKRAALGAKIETKLPGGHTLVRRVRTDGSYLCSHDARVLLGLGEVTALDSLTITWPDGSKQVLSKPDGVNRYLTITKGVKP